MIGFAFSNHISGLAYYLRDTLLPSRRRPRCSSL